MKVVQEIGRGAKWLVASLRNDVAGVIVIAMVAGLFVRIFVFH